jgi:anti-repressor protein
MTYADMVETDASRQPVVTIRENEAFADSRDVAAYFGKHHKNVLRDIRSLHCTADFRRLNFEPININDLTGETTSHVMMTKDGFLFLVLGFGGDTAGKLKEAYINQFNAMQAELKRRLASEPPVVDLEDPATLQGLLLTQCSKRIEAEKRATVAEAEVEAAKPKTSFFDRFVNAEGLFGLQNAGRCLQQGPNKFVSFLKRGYLFYQGGSLIPKVQFREAGLFEVKPYMDDQGKARYQTYVTAKGIEYFARKLGVSPVGGAA